MIEQTGETELMKYAFDEKMMPQMQEDLEYFLHILRGDLATQLSEKASSCSMYIYICIYICIYNMNPKACLF